MWASTFHTADQLRIQLPYRSTNACTPSCPGVRSYDRSRWIMECGFGDGTAAQWFVPGGGPNVLFPPYVILSFFHRMKE
jgi:hypothetical protein